jgi:hypothetical protein
MIKLGDTFKADGNVWKVYDINLDYSYLKLKTNEDDYIAIYTDIKKVYAWLDDGTNRYLSFAEIKMVAEIIDCVTT